MLSGRVLKHRYYQIELSFSFQPSTEKKDNIPKMMYVKKKKTKPTHFRENIWVMPHEIPNESLKEIKMKFIITLYSVYCCRELHVLIFIY